MRRRRAGHGGREQHASGGRRACRRAASRRPAGSPGPASRRPRRARRCVTCFEAQVLLLGEVEQPAGGADDDLDALLQRLDLRLVGAAAVDGERRGVAQLAGGVEVAGDLDGELAGRARRPAPAACREPRARRSRPRPGPTTRCSSRDAEAEGLAGAGLGLADDVVAGQGDRQGHRLDREGVGDADAGERLDDRGGRRSRRRWGGPRARSPAPRPCRRRSSIGRRLGGDVCVCGHGLLPGRGGGRTPSCTGRASAGQHR